MSVLEHKEGTNQKFYCKVITVSDTRDRNTDKSGALMQQLLQEQGHQVIQYEIVQDDWESIRTAILAGSHDERVDAILMNGGTGIAKRDVTIETVSELLDKEIVGFGELFRMLSYTEDIGSAAIMSRAIAGVVKDTAVFCTPGSSGAVKLAMNKLIIPELGHVIREVRKDL